MDKHQFVGPNPGDVPRWPTSEESTFLAPPSVEVTFTLAATRAADIGFTIEVQGEPTDDAIDSAIERGERAIAKALVVRQRAMYFRDNPPPVEFQQALWGDPAPPKAE